MRRLLVTLLLPLAACGGDDQVVSEPRGTSLVIEHRADEAAPVQRWTLTCDPPGGDHPQPEAACRDLAAQDDPFAQIPPDTACTEIYGGPQTATVRGSYRGDPVDIALSRTNGCFIAQWDRVGALVPAPS